MNETHERTALPLPGESCDGGTVVASVWLDDDDAMTALLLILMPEAPFYRVCEVYAHGGTWTASVRTRHENIVPAVEMYEQSGGDY